jgi:multiple sugar transport system ATP-binding protein
VSSVRLEQLTKAFGGVLVVNRIDLAVPKGSMTCILGPSGCGKSTTLRMIAGLVEPTDGEIYFDDQPVRHVPTERRDVGLVFQHYALFPRVSVFDNIAFGLRVRKVPPRRIRTTVTEIAERLELSATLNRPAHKLDLSAAQRVALARTLVTQPRVLLLDEPLNNIRPGLRETLRVHLKRIQVEAQQTTVYVTHDQEEALTLGDQIVVMRAGRLEQVGSSEEVYLRPRTLFVASFLGRPPMNLLPATVDHGALRGDWGSFEWNGHHPTAGEVIAGIRPEHLQVTPRQNAALSGRVVASQAMGRVRLVAVDLAGVRVWVKTSEAVPIGAEIGLSPAAERLVLFDPRSGEAI